MMYVKDLSNEPYDSDDINRLFEEESDADCSISEEKPASREITVTAGELRRLRVVSAGARVGCMLLAILVFVAALVLPIVFHGVSLRLYWAGMSCEAAALVFVIINNWIKYYVIGE